MPTPRIRWLLAAVVLSLAGTGCARRIRTPPPPEAFNGDYFRFPTGLQLAVYEDPTAARVSVTVSYGSGSHQDPSGEEGTAHLVEHLTGHGRPAGGRSIDARLFALGALDNAFTSADETQYVADVPPAGLAALLGLEAERMRDPLANVSEAEFGIERGVVETERTSSARAGTSPARSTAGSPRSTTSRTGSRARPPATRRRTSGPPIRRRSPAPTPKRSRAPPASSGSARRRSPSPATSPTSSPR